MTLAAFTLALGSSCGVEVHLFGVDPNAAVTGGGGFAGGGTGGSISVSGSGGSNVTLDAGPTGAGGQSGSDGGGMAAGTGGAGAAPSGIMVNIGGTMVPKEKVIAFIHFGHSNMAGRGEAPTALRPEDFMTAASDVDKRAWMFHAGGAHAGFQPALEPFTAGDTTSLSSNPPTGGPGTMLVKEAAKMWPGYYFVSLGFGQNAAYCHNFLPGSAYYRAAMAGAMALKGQVTFGGIVVMLGITERHDPGNIPNYPSCMNTIITQIRQDIGEPNLPLLLTAYEQWANDSRGEDLRPIGPFGMAIIPQILKVPTTVTNSRLVPTDNCMNLIDDHHFQLDSHQNWVLNALGILKMQPGWTPWAKSM
ncbi:MAG TPA: sialate O-acetylesterase [Polyangia bacterium]|nr:sialate O-acetylesterase [Polyangia bacterium]